MLLNLYDVIVKFANDTVSMINLKWKIVDILRSVMT